MTKVGANRSQIFRVTEGKLEFFAITNVRVPNLERARDVEICRQTATGADFGVSIVKSWFTMLRRSVGQK